LFQGLIIFYVNCLRQKEVRNLWWETCKKSTSCFSKGSKLAKSTDAMPTTSTSKT